MKWAKTNEIKLDPLAYNLALIGESGIGKTTIIKEYCEKLAGKDKYIFLNFGKEDGSDAIDGIRYLNCWDWDADFDENTYSVGFNTFVEDVVENRSTDWKDLRVVVIDTYDELFSIAEPEVVRMHNRENPNKKVKSIKAAFGGFQGGEDKTVEIVLDRLWALKRVGVSFIIIGHTKTRNITDPVTGEDYMQLTTNMPQKYFNAIKTKVHFLGVASIDREIVKQKTGKKNIATGEEIRKGVVKGETRRITFRDNNFVIDSKSRFSQIEENIPFDADSLIHAVTDAIKKEQSKSGISIESALEKQRKEHEEFLERITKREFQTKNEKELSAVLDQIMQYLTNNKSDIEGIVKPILQKCREMGHSSPKEITNIEDARSILDMCK